MDEFQEISDFERKVINSVAMAIVDNLDRKTAINLSVDLETKGLTLVKQTQNFAEKKEAAKVFLLSEKLLSLARKAHPLSSTTEPGK